jgi:hypothetical protein
MKGFEKIAIGINLMEVELIQWKWNHICENGNNLMEVESYLWKWN